MKGMASIENIEIQGLSKMTRNLDDVLAESERILNKINERLDKINEQQEKILQANKILEGTLHFEEWKKLKKGVV